MTTSQPRFRSDERGAALLLAIIVLATMAIIALGVGSMTAVDRRMTGDEVTQAKALRFAEAGVAEALSRIANGEGPSPINTNAVVQVLLTSSVGSAGADTTLLATSQPAGQWLTYSTATKGGSALTIQFVTNAAHTRIMRYDKTLDPAIQTMSGMPIYKITSTGRIGDVSRTIVTHSVYNAPPVELKASLVSRQPISLYGSSMSCGFNHRIDTPSGTGSSGRSGGGGCNENPTANPPMYELPAGGVPGIWSTGAVTLNGSSTAYGVPATVPNSVAFYSGPWEIFDMTAPAFWSWLGPAQYTMPSTPTGITYLDNDGTPLNASGNWSLNNGSGLLVADGNVDLQGNWRGVIYAEGNVTLNGNAWVLGAIISNQNSLLKITGDATILYSKDAISDYVGTQMPGGSFTTLSWVES